MAPLVVLAVLVECFVLYHLMLLYDVKTLPALLCIVLPAPYIHPSLHHPLHALHCHCLSCMLLCACVVFSFSDASKNDLYGPLPTSLQTLTQSLRAMSFANNPRITGQLNDVSNTGQLVEFILTSTDVTGAIPQSWSSMSSIQKLELADTNLTCQGTEHNPGACP